MILPKSLREKQDRESYVSRLIDLTRTLCHEPKPTAENFTSITHSVCIVLDEWASFGRDTKPYKEEVEWVYPFYKFTQSMRLLPPDKDDIRKQREYAIDGAEKKEIDEAMWDLYRDLEKIAFQFELRLTDARDPRVPLKRYGGEADCNQPWWWRPIFDSEEVNGEGLTTQVRLRTGVVGFFTEDLDAVLHSFELLAADNAPPESDIRHEYDKLIQELDMSKNGNVRTTQEDELRCKFGPPAEKEAQQARQKVDSAKSKPSRGKPKRGRQGSRLRGPKTKVMEEQLRVFSHFVIKQNYDGDESKLYALANQCWLANKKKWDKMKSAEGQKKGYSSAKIMADAYKKTKQ